MPITKANEMTGNELLIKVIMEQAKIIQALKAKIAELEGVKHETK